MKSEICIFDLASGKAESLLSVEGHVEAPNWHPEEPYLVVNSKGRLYAVDVAEPSLVEIDTGFATSCNNDHGISPDGMTLVISDKTEFDKSAIYTLPMGGGTPRLVTQSNPSYWHGWSPDGQTLAFVGKRSRTFQIFTIPAQGGPERQITHEFDHCDGPDFTPDGQWIWFNGEKNGSVDLWRIRPDGTELEQMTFDERVNWFPHPSPNGEAVVYLAYPAGTKGHPPNLNVKLCLMSSNGGTPRTLVELFGGQGTINVPSWSPDSRKFAFVRYAL